MSGIPGPSAQGFDDEAGESDHDDPEGCPDGRDDVLELVVVAAGLGVGGAADALAALAAYDALD